MISSSFQNDEDTSLVLDASVVINLNATGQAKEILAAVPNPVIVTNNVLSELQNGAKNGHNDGALLEALIVDGRVTATALPGQSVSTYEQLIEGPAALTLDDGEAATIAHSVHKNAVAVIDEKKGRILCATSFPTLTVASTIEIITHPGVALSLGKASQIEALFAALSKGRMRVPEEHVDMVVVLIGKERACKCTSLPRRVRLTHG